MWKCHNGANQDWTYMPDTQQIKDKKIVGSVWIYLEDTEAENQLQTWSCDTQTTIRVGNRRDTVLQNRVPISV
jgi:hypothetical protein